MMLIIMTVLACLLAVLAAGQFWLLITITRRNEDLTFELEDRDRQIFADIRTMFGMQEIIDQRTAERDGAYRNIEMLVEAELKKDADFAVAMELALNA